MAVVGVGLFVEPRRFVLREKVGTFVLSLLVGSCTVALFVLRGAGAVPIFRVELFFIGWALEVFFLGFGSCIVTLFVIGVSNFPSGVVIFWCWRWRFFSVFLLLAQLRCLFLWAANFPSGGVYLWH